MQRFDSVRRAWLLLFAGLVASLPASLAVSGTEPPVLVVIGASYAADWGRPALDKYSVVNRGVGGEETANVRARFERDVLAAKPAAVLIWGHINNIHRAPPGQMDAAKQRAREDLRDMALRARAQGIEVYLGTEVTLPESVGFMNGVAAFIGGLRGKESYAAKINREVRAVNVWLRELARQEGMTLLDFEQALDDGDGFRRSEYTQDDGSHISPAGYAALTRFTRERLGVK